MVCENRYRTKSFKLCRCSCRWRCKCLIPRKNIPHPPFNTGVPIDVKRGMHPKLTMNSVDAPPPGAYTPNIIIGKLAYATDWAKEEACKEFSATMGGRLLEKYAVQRELMKSGRGPGTHEIRQWPEAVLERSCLAEAKDTGFGVAPRFKISQTRATPGPGYTGRDHNPYHYVDTDRFKPRNSCLSTFQFDGMAPRFKNPSRSWSIACNRYNAQHPGCLDKILGKVTSRRGPYDLFTGPRDSSTIFGYLARLKSIDTKNWPAKIPRTEFERAFGGSNRHKGVWTDCPRFTKKPTVRSMLDDVSLCYKDPDAPGPGYYDPGSPQKPGTRSLYPFNDSVSNARPLRPFEISPGPGTYRLISEKKSITGNGWTWTFKSKAQRSIGPKLDRYNAF